MTRTITILAAVLAASLAAGGAALARDKQVASAPAACAEAAPQGFRTTSACKAKGGNARFSWTAVADASCQCEATDACVRCSADGPATITIGADGTWKTWYGLRGTAIEASATGAADLSCRPAAAGSQAVAAK